MNFQNDHFGNTPGRPLRLYTSEGNFYDFSTDDFVGKKLNFFKGWLCGLGSENLYVDMDGDVYGASCRMLGKLGNVFEDFQIPKSWSVCAQSICTCGADLFIPKVKSPQNKELLAKTLQRKVDLQKKLSEEPAASEFLAMERTHASHLKQVYWEIGRRCNYDCSYCLPSIHNKSDRHKTLLELIQATNRVIEKFAGGKNVNFIVSGGEPTLNPDFLDWARYISTMGHYLSMHSNGSRLPKYYRELIHYGDLNLSLHFEMYQPQKFIDVVAEIVDEKVKHQNQGVGHLEIKLMMAPGRRHESLQMQDALCGIPNFKEFCTWAFVPIRDLANDDHVTAGYEPEDIKLFGNGVV